MDEHRERQDGPGLWAEDVELVRDRSGADHVQAVEELPAELGRRLFRGRLAVHTPFAPGEGERETRDVPRRGRRPAGTILSARAKQWRVCARRSAAHFPSAELFDLTPLLDDSA